MNKGKRLPVKGYGLWVLLCSIWMLMGCDPLAHYELDNVKISSHSELISAGFIEHVFSTDKDAYYLIGIEPVREGYDPGEARHQKQFMTLELDSAHLEYLDWRRRLLQQGEEHIASFASHALQYGQTDFHFTGLTRSTAYWIYAFVVDPERMVPKGKLHLMKVYTTSESTMDVKFAYRVKGDWDYVYPQDSKGNIEAHYPYIMETVDSLDVAKKGLAPREYFIDRESFWTEYPQFADIQYGLQARQNNGYEGNLEFEEGHVYYTFICGLDDGFFHPTIYKFRWEDKQTDVYFTDRTTNNLFNYSDRW